MEHARLQIDDLREMRQYYEEQQYRREEWPDYRERYSPRGVFQIDLVD